MKHLILGTAGHVDHGKTALIKAMTGIDCDTHKEEKERGITINLGFSHFNLSSGDSMGIVDVPGHKDFIKTMVAGAYGIDIVLLVVAADSGIMPQTREHLQIIEMLGIEKGIVALNKADLVDEETLELGELEISEFLEGTKLSNAPILPVSSLTGKGIPELLETINNTIPEIREKEESDRFRMYIDRIFNVKGVGFVVTGSVLEGKISVGNDLYLLPGKSKKIKIRNLERHGEQVNTVYGGDRAAINLTGMKYEDYSRGMVLSNQSLEPTSMMDATVTLFDHSVYLNTWSTVTFYTGTFECLAKVHLLDKENLPPGETGIVQIHLDKPTILFNKDKYIMRNSSNDLTLGGGTIIDASPLHHKKRTEKVIGDLTDLANAVLHSDKVVNLVKIELNKIKSPVFLSMLAERFDKDEKSMISEITGEGSSGTVLLNSENKTIAILEKSDKEYRNFILDEITNWHAKNPILQEGLETEYFYGKMNFSGNEAGKLYLENVLAQMQSEGAIRREKNTWVLKGHEASIDKKIKEQLDWLSNTILNVGMEKPNPADIAALAHENKINKERLKMMLRFLGQNDTLYFHEGEYIHRSIVDQCRKTLLGKISIKEDGINEKEFRELINGTKKLVQMLVSIFLEEGIISKKTFFLLITEKGKQISNLNN
ncbi:MAG: selenocysteine-specific translation elongation factor [Bacteroidales bacterium]|nr:selenocysteine-specific translation elongation factor [Bacteroidales bacterium]